MSDARNIFKDPALQQQFMKQGYLKLPLFTPEMLEQLRQEYHNIPFDDGGKQFHSTMMVDNADYRKQVDDLIKKAFQPVVDELLVDYSILFANYIIKQSGPDTEVPIHLDWAYLDEDKYSSINIWCPLIATNNENGALHVLPGSQKLQTPDRYTPFHPLPFEDLFDDIKAASVQVTTQLGEAIIYSSSLLHWSPPNRSGKVREAIGLVTAPQEAQTLHLFRPSMDEDKLEVYKADAAFFHHFIIGEQPKGELLETRKVDTACFTREDLYKLTGKPLAKDDGLWSKIKKLWTQETPA